MWSRIEESMCYKWKVNYGRYIQAFKEADTDKEHGMISEIELNTSLKRTSSDSSGLSSTKTQ